MPPEEEKSADEQPDDRFRHLLNEDEEAALESDK